MTRTLLSSLVVLLAVLVTASACRSEAPQQVPDRPTAQPPAPAPVQPPARREAPVASGKPPRLPEDPAAGKRSELQWREHLDEEEEERQAGFDRRRLKQHRALVKQIAAARARYDRAHTEAALAKVRADMPGRIAAMRKLVAEIDPKGVSSRLLQDYAALQSSLEAAYPDAKAAAIRGDSHALEQARADFDQHMKKIAHWLKEVAEGKGEYE